MSFIIKRFWRPPPPTRPTKHPPTMTRCFLQPTGKFIRNGCFIVCPPSHSSHQHHPVQNRTALQSTGHPSIQPALLLMQLGLFHSLAINLPQTLCLSGRFFSRRIIHQFQVLRPRNFPITGFNPLIELGINVRRPGKISSCGSCSSWKSGLQTKPTHTAIVQCSILCGLYLPCGDELRLFFVDINLFEYLNHSAVADTSIHFALKFRLKLRWQRCRCGGAECHLFQHVARLILQISTEKV